MATSAAVKIEVRWRETGTEQWSDISTIAPTAQIVVEGLDRTKTYDFEWRGVSACGARSAWGSTTQGVPAQGMPTAISTITAASLADGVHVSWTVPVTAPAGIEYVVQRSPDGATGWVQRARIRALSYTDPETSGTTYYYRVYGVNFADIAGPYSTVVSSNGVNVSAISNTATTAASNVPAVINPQFANGLTSWSPGTSAGWSVQTGGSNLPDPIVNTAAVHTAGGSAAATDALRNGAHIPVVAGQQVTVTCCVKEVGVNAGALGYARISWRDASHAEISVSVPSGTTQYPTCGAAGTGTYTQCVTKVIASAPSGAQYAVAEATVTGHTAGSFLFSNVCMVAQPSSMDELPDGSTYLRQVQNSSSVSIPNANFQLPKDLQGNIPGWVETNTLFYLGTSALFGGMQCGVLKATYGLGNAGAQCTKQFKVSPGDSIWLGASVASLNGGYLFMRATVFDASGTQLAYFQPNTTSTVATNIGGMQLKAPAGSAYVVITLGLVAPSVAGSIYAVFSSIDLRINDVRVAGSGATLGNQLNAPNSLTLNYGGVRSATALTASSSGAVTVNAHTIYMGGTSVHYNAVANAVTGLTVGSTYQIYCHDPAPASGGTKTWYAATSIAAALQQGDDVVIGGQVTIPSSGTSGGGSTTGCPAVDAWVIRRAGDRSEESVRAGEVSEGDYLLLVSGAWGRVTHSVAKRVPCVRATSGCGFSLTCSRSAPLGLAAGGSVLAQDAAGAHVAVRYPVPQLSDMVERVDDIGTGWVQHITCENDFFWAGDDARHLFSHHNMKPG